MPYAGPEQQEPTAVAGTPPVPAPPPASVIGTAPPRPLVQAPNAAGAVWSVASRVLAGIWHGQPVEALGVAQTSERVTGAPSRYWLFTAGAWAALAGMTAATYLVKSANATASAVDSVLSGLTAGLSGTAVSDRFHMGFGAWLGVWVVCTLLTFACLALRVVTTRWTFAMRGASVPFTTVANIVVAAYSVQLPLVALAFLITLVIPVGPGSILLLALLGLVAAIPAWVTEGVIYIGLNRTVRFSKSPLVPHAVMTLVWMALCLGATLVTETVVLSAILR